MKLRLWYLAIPIIITAIAAAWIYEVRHEARIDRHYRENARITKEDAIRIAKRFIMETMSEDSHGYPKNINMPDRIGDDARKWGLVYLIKDEESFPNTTVIEVDKIDGKPAYVPQR